MARKLLLVSPAFQGYWQAITAALSAQGWDVDVHIYDQPGPSYARAANALAHRSPSRAVTALVDDHLSDLAVSHLRSTKPDAILVVRGDQLSSRWWSAAADAQVPLITWAYDELRRMRSDFVSNAGVGTIATYAKPDADSLADAGIDSFYLPNAFDTYSRVEHHTFRATTFIGARYENREAMLLALHHAGVPVVAFGKTWSSRLVDRVRTRQFTPLPFTTLPNVSRAQAYGVMAGSDATLNSHWDQEGFTMRTFEASGVGGVQIIDRSDVDEFYEPGKEVLVYESEDHLIDLCSRISRGALATTSLRNAAQKRTFAEHTFDHRIRVLLEHL